MRIRFELQVVTAAQRFVDDDWFGLRLFGFQKNTGISTPL